ncbi:hypothetical protein JHK87_003770 [Glycine soja]|nr:hypothetical protein JHK87_003770 [Glycine soja]
MSRVHAKIIITDQDVVITNVVARIFSDVIHHYCMCHIQKKKNPEYLSHVYNAHGEFKNQFYKSIHLSLTIDELESNWEAIINKDGLQDNQWLQKMYYIHKKWIPAYVCHNFCAKMSTTQRSESMNKCFKDFPNSSTPLYKKFQDELIGYQKFSVKKIIFVVEVITYKVYEIYNEKTTYNVTYHVNSKEATCNCHLFEFLDILCRHVLAVLIKNAHSLPSQYILR